MKNKDLETIKTYYGERFARFCRENLSSILEIEGELPKFLMSKISPTKALYDVIIQHDISEEFKAYMIRAYNNKANEYTPDQNIETPKQLLAKVGYDLFHCETVEELMKFAKYYSKEYCEVLCTFNNPTYRISEFNIFFAVKKNVNQINRQDFQKPRRQDEYGTSVMSFQFKKPYNILSIKNRYNHTVEKCDSTFGNDLDNIIAGLTESFEVHYGIKQDLKNTKFYLPNFTTGDDGKWYHYNMHTSGAYYCDNNIIITTPREANKNKLVKGSRCIEYYDKARYEIFDNYILDMKEKRIDFHNSLRGGEDKHLTRIKIKNVSIQRLKGTSDKVIHILTDTDKKIQIKINSHSQMIEYFDEHTEVAGDNFLCESTYLQKVELPNLREVGDKFLHHCQALKEIECPNLTMAGDGCLRNALSLKEFIAPDLMFVGNGFLENCNTLENVNLASLEVVGMCFLRNTYCLENITLPEIRKLGADCFCDCRALKTFTAPKLEIVCECCFQTAPSLKELHIPKARDLRVSSFRFVPRLEVLNAESLETLESHCFYNTRGIKKLTLPNLKETDISNFVEVDSLESLELPKVEILGMYNFSNAPVLTSIYAPNLRKVEAEAFKYATRLKVLELPSLEEVGYQAFNEMLSLKEISLPNLTSVAYQSFQRCPKVQSMYFPKLNKVGEKSFMEIDSLETLNIPCLELLHFNSFSKAENLKRLYAPKLKEQVGNNFLGAENLRILKTNPAKRVSKVKKLSQGPKRPEIEL